MSAIVRLNCAEAELAARDTSAARRHAAEAEKAFENARTGGSAVASLQLRSVFC